MLNIFNVPLNLFPSVVIEGDIYELTLTLRDDIKEKRINKINNLFKMLKTKENHDEN